MRMEKEVVTALNGKNYELLAGGKVRQIASSGKFVPNNTEEDLDESVELNNTKILLGFLKQELDDEVVMTKSGVIKWRGYKFYYSSHGFRIEDTLNFSEAINGNDYNNDFAYPADVLKWLTKNRDRKLEPPPDEKEKIKVATRLSDKFTVKGKNLTEKPSRDVALKDEEERKKEIVQTAKITRLDNATEAFKVAFKKKAPIAELKKLSGRVSKRKDFIKEINSLIFKVKRGKITDRKFIDEFNKLVKPLHAPKEPILKKASKFHGLDYLWEPTAIGVPDKDGKVLVSLLDPSKKRYNLKVHLAQYLTNVVLFEFPKAMPLLMKVAQGEMFNYNEIDLTSKFIRDPYVEYNKKILDTSEHFGNLQECCQEILWENEMPSALDTLYSKSFKVGDQVKVFWADNCAWYTAEVISTITGIRVRYDEDGEVFPVLNHQKIKKHE